MEQCAVAAGGKGFELSVRVADVVRDKGAEIAALNAEIEKATACLDGEGYSRRRRLPWWLWRQGVPVVLLLAVWASTSIQQTIPVGVGGWLNTARTVAHQAPASPLVGRASVIDGDTVEIAGQRVRFNGIDAPESAQSCKDANGANYPCGRRSAEALDAWLTASRPLRCVFVEWDRYGRFVGDCARTDGASVASWLVSSGHAMDWPRYSNAAHANEQAAARVAHLGIWQGEVQPPWEWRAAQNDATNNEAADDTAPAHLLSGSCDIKGNISAKGERIYHVPGQTFYDDTVISPGKGERWFCSEAEARQAGWRRSRR